MRPTVPLVALDAGVLVEAIKLGDPDRPSGRILLAARVHAFRLVLLAPVEQEARKALASAGLERVLDERLAECMVVRAPGATEEQLREQKALVWALVRHEPDAEIGVAIKAMNPRPALLVSSNRRHWRTTIQVCEAIGGVQVMRMEQFANLINPD